jgi:hypothetical protein
MHRDADVLAELLAEAGVEASTEDLAALVRAHVREEPNLAELRALTLRWDGPEPATANDWLERAGG